MADEVNFETHLVDVQDAVKMLFRDEARVVHYAWTLFEKVRLRPLHRRLRATSCLRCAKTCKQTEALEAQRLAQSDSSGSGSGSTSYESPSSV